METSNSPFSYNHFSTISIFSNLDNLVLPIQISGQLVIQEDRLALDQSTFSLRWNQQKWTDRLKQAIKKEKKSGLSSLLSSLAPYANVSPPSSHPNISKGEYELLKNLYVFEWFREIIANPQLQQKSSRWETEIDSLSKLPNTPTIQKNLDSLLCNLEVYNKIKTQYNEHLESIQKHDHQVRRGIISKLDSLQKQINYNEQQLGESINKIRRDSSVSWLTKFALNTQKFEFGLFSPTLSDFTLQNILLNGAQIQYDNGTIHTSTGIGASRIRRNFYSELPSFFNQEDRGSFFTFIQVGSSQEKKQRLIGTIVHNKKRFTSDTLITFPKEQNQVYSLQYDHLISKTWSFTSEIALSNYRFSNSSISSTEPNNVSPQNLAFQIDLQCYTGKKLGTRWSIGAFRVGPSFLSLGSPFLQSGRNGLDLSVRGNVTSWLTSSLQLEYYFPNQDYQQISNSRFSDFRLLGKLNARIGRSFRAWAEFSPNYISQTFPESTVATNQFQYLTQGGLIFTKRWIARSMNTTFFYSNYQLHWDLPDSVLVNGKNTFWINQGVTWQENLSTSFDLNWMLSSENNLIQVRAVNTHSYQRGNFQYGLRWRSGSIDKAPMAGLIGSFDVAISNLLLFNLRGSYLIPTNYVSSTNSQTPELYFQVGCQANL